MTHRCPVCSFNVELEATAADSQAQVEYRCSCGLDGMIHLEIMDGEIHWPSSDVLDEMLIKGAESTIVDAAIRQAAAA